MKSLNHNQIVWILVVLVALTVMLCSCNIQRNIVTYEPTDKIKWDVLYPIAKYDSCKLIRKKFLQSNSTLIYLQGTTCVIEGKKCEFKIGEMLYYKVVKWHPPDFSGSYCKYFISNKDESIRYLKL